MNDDPTIAELHAGIWWLPKCPWCGLAIHVREMRLKAGSLFVLGWHPNCNEHAPWRKSDFPNRSTLN